MKKPIVQTQFLEDIVDELECFHTLKGLHFTVDNLEQHLKLAFEIVENEINKLIIDLNELWDNGNGDYADVYEIKQSIDSFDRLHFDLTLLSNLETTAYANPNHIASSIEFLSERLVAQLEAKVSDEACYNEYQCKQISRVLAELCNII